MSSRVPTYVGTWPARQRVRSQAKSGRRSRLNYSISTGLLRRLTPRNDTMHMFKTKLVNKMRNLKIYTDGGSRGNPGPSAIGVLILDDKNKELFRLGKQIGRATNNMAEYTAVLEALLWVKNKLIGHDLNIKFYLDSSLAVNQLTGTFKIKNQELKKIIIKIKCLEKEIAKTCHYIYIPREANKIADLLVNSSF